MQQTTHHGPPSNSTATSAIGWNAAMALVRTAAAAMAGWSLYVVARHYDTPRPFALVSGLVFDGVAYLCLRAATEAVRANRSAVAPVLATIAMASVSIYLNLVHARFTGGGRPAEVLYAAPAVALLLVSAIAWTAERAAAKAQRGETPMRLPTYGAFGWLLAREQAITNLRERAVAHVTSGASAAHQPASAPARRDHRAVLREKFAEMDPSDAIQISAASNPNLNNAELADLCADYGITVTALDVALVLGQRAVPSITLDRVPDPSPARGQQPALNRVMRRDATADMPQVKGLPTAQAITLIAEQLGGLNADPKAIAKELALQDMATDTGYIRTALSRARAEEKATEQQRAEHERRHGNGGYA
ncbi:hypothetical protein ACWEO1_22670 [Kitasatospora cineracea]